MRHALHFAHGNGFPSPCYRQLLNGLETQFDCVYIDRIGHTPVFPVTDNWHCLVDEVISSIEAQTKEPVIAVGHSLGGGLSLLAAIEKPSLFQGVILLDSPLLGRMKSHVVRFSKIFGMIDRLTPAHRTRARRTHWKSREEVWCYLKSRALFKTFTDACLNDYIDFGLEHTEAGDALRFDPRIEYQIYRTIPDVLHRYEGRLHVPATVIYGHQSTVIDSSDLRYMDKKYGISNIEIRGTHMFPMEYPELVADVIKRVAEKMLGCC